ncbi:SapC family protein [Roseinatronobacter sp. NSM]|uniref:SapC family protein n=1 Tax=Roseinatronobacter sp. NSM TaxID=3457785 RepID=UPI004036E1F3
MISAGADLTPVSAERHGARRWRRFSSFDFVQAHQLVPIVLGEHEQVAACLPVFFTPAPAGTWWPIALTRLGARTALVGSTGAWRGSYVPSILRIHPFQARQTDSGQFALLVAEGSGLVTDDPGDEPFFTPDGQLAPALAQVVAFFRNRAQAETQTRAAMAEFARLNLLAPFRPPDEFAASMPALMTVDGEKLAGLARSELSLLHRCGGLELAYSALVARHHLAFLAQAELRDSAAPKPARAPASAPDPALTGFFDALATARGQEPDLTTWMGGQPPPRDSNST